MLWLYDISTIGLAGLFAVHLARRPLHPNGKYVVARTADVSYSIRQVTKSYLASYGGGEGHCRYYDGPGRVLICYSPYWRHHVFSQNRELAMAAG